MSENTNTIIDRTDRELAFWVQNRESMQKIWDSIIRTVNEALPVQDYDRLLALIPYMQDGDASIVFRYLGESLRLMSTLRIIELERKYQLTPFSINCYNEKELMEKYMLTLFAIRRLQFMPSESSVLEAAFFLKQNEISIFAIHTIIKDDLINPEPSLYRKIIELHTENSTSV